MEREHDVDLVLAQHWKAYRTAFRGFAQKARFVQLLEGRENVQRDAMESALLEMEKARVAYNAARDRLAQELLKSSARPQDTRFRAAMQSTDAPRVKELAQLIWELTGRPEDTADDDWRRAEEILRRAQAA